MYYKKKKKKKGILLERLHKQWLSIILLSCAELCTQIFIFCPAEVAKRYLLAIP